MEGLPPPHQLWPDAARIRVHLPAASSRIHEAAAEQPPTRPTNPSHPTIITRALISIGRSRCIRFVVVLCAVLASVALFIVTLGLL